MCKYDYCWFGLLILLFPTMIINRNKTKIQQKKTHQQGQLVIEYRSIQYDSITY